MSSVSISKRYFHYIAVSWATYSLSLIYTRSDVYLSFIATSAFGFSFAFYVIELLDQRRPGNYILLHGGLFGLTLILEFAVVYARTGGYYSNKAYDVMLILFVCSAIMLAASTVIMKWKLS